MRTHEISEWADKHIGYLERRLKRTERALGRSLAVIGANMAEFPDGLYPAPGSQTFAEDIRLIHGLAPERKHITDAAYQDQLGVFTH